MIGLTNIQREITTLYIYIDVCNICQVFQKDLLCKTLINIILAENFVIFKLLEDVSRIIPNSSHPLILIKYVYGSNLMN